MKNFRSKKNCEIRWMNQKICALGLTLVLTICYVTSSVSAMNTYTEGKDNTLETERVSSSSQHLGLEFPVRGDYLPLNIMDDELKLSGTDNTYSIFENAVPIKQEPEEKESSNKIETTQVANQSSKPTATKERPVETIIKEVYIQSYTFIVSAESGTTEVKDGMTNKAFVIGYLDNEDIVTGTKVGENWIKLNTKESTYVEADDLIEHETEIKEIPTTDIKSSDFTVNTNINTSSGLTVSDLTKLFEGTYLEGLETAFVNAEMKYGVNTYLALGIAKTESGWGVSNAGMNSNNLFGVMTSKQIIKYFNTKTECIDYWYDLIANYYIAVGLDTPAKIATKYCPGEADVWLPLLTSIMNSTSSKV